MKNMDPLNDNIIALLQNSSDTFVGLLWKDSGMLTLRPKSDQHLISSNNIISLSCGQVTMMSIK